VGQYIQGTGYVAGSAGWRINGDGTAEFSDVVVRGTVYATAGQIGGNTIDATSIHSGTTGYGTGSGFYLGSNGTFSLSDKLTWNGSVLSINGGGTFSGALSAATGTFAGALSAATGSFAGALSAASGTFSGTLTADAVNAVSRINIADEQIVIPRSAYTAGNILVGESLVLLQSVYIDVTGFKCNVAVNFLFTGPNGFANIRIVIYRNATPILDQTSMILGFPSFSLLDTPGTMGVTYSVYASTTSGWPDLTVGSRSIVVMGVAK
jgi:hypothetical protein